MLQKGGQVTNSKKFETCLKVHCYAAIIKIMKYLDAWHPLNNRLLLANSWPYLDTKVFSCKYSYIAVVR